MLVVQSPSRVWLFATPWTAARQACLSLTISQSLPKFMSIASMMPSSHLILWHPLFPLPSIFPSIRDFSSESALCSSSHLTGEESEASVKWLVQSTLQESHRTWPNREIPWLISFRMDWLDPLAVQGTLKSLLQHQSSKLSILWHSAFFCLLRNLYAGQEATVRTGHGTTDWFQIGKGIRQGCILSPCLFNFYAEHIMRNAGLDEAQTGIKIAGRNINNLRYTDDTTLMAESKELKSFLMKVKEESGKTWLTSPHSEN